MYNIINEHYHLLFVFVANVISTSTNHAITRVSVIVDCYLLLADSWYRNITRFVQQYVGRPPVALLLSLVQTYHFSKQVLFLARGFIWVKMQYPIIKYYVGIREMLVVHLK